MSVSKAMFGLWAMERQSVEEDLRNAVKAVSELTCLDSDDPYLTNDEVREMVSEALEDALDTRDLAGETIRERTA